MERDGVRLLLSSHGTHTHHRFRDLAELLSPGDLLVVNDSATLAASLPAARLGPPGGERFRLNLSTRYGERMWLAEPRRSAAEPGPLAVVAGERGVVGKQRQVAFTFVAAHPGIPRLWFVAPDAPLEPVMSADGEPIRYGYVTVPQPLAAYQTVFARVPGSAEMPSAARPFTSASLAALAKRGVEVTSITLHAGVSSLELAPHASSLRAGSAVLYAEPFDVPAATARAITAARERGAHVVAVGTTVVRALETAFTGGRVAAMRGFTRRFVTPGAARGSVDGLITGFHEPASTHLALLVALAGTSLVERAYAAALEGGYLWHEFGDSHLLLWRQARGSRAAAASQ